MQSWAKTALVLMILLLLSTIFLALLYRPPETNDVIPESPRRYVEIRIFISRIEPDRITVDQGTILILNVTAVEGDHTLVIADFGASIMVREGRTSTVTIPANLPGEHVYRCIVPSPEHRDEQGTLEVVP